MKKRRATERNLPSSVGTRPQRDRSGASRGTTLPRSRHRREAASPQGRERVEPPRHHLDGRLPTGQRHGESGIRQEDPGGWTERRFHLGTYKEIFDAEVFAVYQDLSVIGQRQQSDR